MLYAIQQDVTCVWLLHYSPYYHPYPDCFLVVPIACRQHLFHLIYCVFWVIMSTSCHFPHVRRSYILRSKRINRINLTIIKLHGPNKTGIRWSGRVKIILQTCGIHQWHSKYITILYASIFRKIKVLYIQKQVLGNVPSPSHTHTHTHSHQCCRLLDVLYCVLTIIYVSVRSLAEFDCYLCL